jgi:hypothetical protein
VAEAFFGLVFLSGFPIMCQFLLLLGKFGASAICRQFWASQRLIGLYHLPIAMGTADVNYSIEVT